MNNSLPEVSGWYQDLVSGKLFEVVAIDEAAGTIGYQLADGEIGEYEFAVWRRLYLVPAAAPEDWRGPYELNSEDRVCGDQVLVPENWSGPLAGIEPERMDLGDDFRII